MIHFDLFLLCKRIIFTQRRKLTYSNLKLPIEEHIDASATILRPMDADIVPGNGHLLPVIVEHLDLCEPEPHGVAPVGLHLDVNR